MEATIGDTIYFDFVTHRFDTGAATDDDATPTVEVFEDATDTTVYALTAVKRTAKTGNYRVAIAATGANGFEAGKSYSVIATATVNSVIGKGVVGRFTARANDIEDVALATALATAQTDLDTITGSDGVLIATAEDHATATALATAQADLDVLTGSDGATLATAQGNYAPAKAGDAMALTSGERTTLTAAIWNAATSGMTTVGSIGKKLADWSIHSATDVWAAATRTLTAFTGFGTATEAKQDTMIATQANLATATALATAQATVDSILTGAPAQKYGGQYGPGIYYDDGAANTSTTLGTDGTSANPVSTLGAATTLCTSLGVNRIYIQGQSTLALTGQTLTDYDIIGGETADAATVNLGTAASQSTLTRCRIINCTVYGEHDASDRLRLRDCLINDAPAAEVTFLHVLAINCGLIGDFELDTSTNNIFEGCYSGVAGNSYPVCTATGAAGTVVFRHYSGGIGFENLSASHTASVEGAGQVVFESGCNVNASVSIRGTMSVTDNTAGMTSLTETARIDRPAINAEADTAISDAALATAAALATHDGKLDTLDTVADAIKAKTDNLPTDPADQSLVIAATDAIVAAIAALNDLDAAGVRGAVGMAAADLDTQIATLATTADLGVVDGVADSILAVVGSGTHGNAAIKVLIDTLDAVADAVKAKTDSLTFTQAGHVDANVQRINDVAITGDGSGTPFGV